MGFGDTCPLCPYGSAPDFSYMLLHFETLPNDMELRSKRQILDFSLL